MRTCQQCGYRYTEPTHDFEPGTSRCWRCAATDHKKGYERLKRERDEARAELARRTKERDRAREWAREHHDWRCIADDTCNCGLDEALTDEAKGSEE